MQRRNGTSENGLLSHASSDNAFFLWNIIKTKHWTWRKTLCTIKETCRQTNRTGGLMKAKQRIFLFVVLLTAALSVYATDVSLKKIPSKKENSMNIIVSITSDSGNYTLYAMLADNKSADAFYELLKKGAVTIDMRDYGGFEKVGQLGTTLPRSDSNITTDAGDIILYQGNQVTIYYDVNTWNFTKLGKITGVSKSELKKTLGKGSILATFRLIE